jgi:MFS family permease
LGVADSIAAPVFGRYLGVLKHDRLNREQLVKLDFFLSKSTASNVNLKAILSLQFGGFETGEYVSYHFDDVQFQLITGALSDRLGRKWLIASGMWVQAVGIGLFVVGKGFWAWMLGAILLGLGTAMVYPTLLAAVSDVAHPEWRASAVGVYRLWRDGGYAVGALAAGLLADAFNIPTAIAAIGGLTLLSGLVVAAVMRETLPVRQLASELRHPKIPL